LKKCGKRFGHFPAWKRLEKNFFGLLGTFSHVFWQYLALLFLIRSIILLFITLTIIVPVFSLGIVQKKAAKGLEICIQNCVGVLERASGVVSFELTSARKSSSIAAVPNKLL